MILRLTLVNDVPFGLSRSVITEVRPFNAPEEPLCKCRIYLRPDAWYSVKETFDEVMEMLGEIKSKGPKGPQRSGELG